MRPEALKSALEGETLKAFTNLRSRAKVESFVLCLMNVSMMKCPHPCTAYEGQQSLVRDIGIHRTRSPRRLTAPIGRFRRSRGSRCQVVTPFCLVHVYAQELCNKSS